MAMPVCVSALLLAGLFAGCAGAAAAADIAKALDAFRSGDCETALTLLRPALAGASAPPGAVHAAAVCEAKTGNLRAANRLFRQLAGLQPNAWQAWNNLGVNELELGSPGEAIAALRKANQLAASEPGPALNLASAYARTGDQRAAFRTLDAVQLTAPGNAEVTKAWLTIAALIAQSAAQSIADEQYARALEDLLLVRRPLEGEASWHNLTGYAHFRLDHPKPALEHLQKALALDPDNEDYVLDISEFLSHHRSYDQLHEVLSVATQRNPRSPRLRLGFALAEILQNRRDAAIPVLQRLLQDAPDFEPAYAVLAECYQDAGLSEDSVRLGRKLQQLNPANPKGWYIEGSALLDLARRREGNLATAVESLTRAVEIDPSFTRARFVLGRGYIEEGRMEDAERELQAVLRAEPKHPRAHYVLGRLYQQRGEHGKAKIQMAEHSRLKEEDRTGEYRRLIIENVAHARVAGPR